MSGAPAPTGGRRGGEPAHPFVPALLLMGGVVLLIVALAAASVLT